MNDKNGVLCTQTIPPWQIRGRHNSRDNLLAKC